jgi:hypothetical protein
MLDQALDQVQESYATRIAYLCQALLRISWKEELKPRHFWSLRLRAGGGLSAVAALDTWGLLGYLMLDSDH